MKPLEVAPYCEAVVFISIVAKLNFLSKRDKTIFIINNNRILETVTKCLLFLAHMNMVVIKVTHLKSEDITAYN